MIHKKLLCLFAERGVKYEQIDHPRAFVADKVAAATNASCNKMLKTVIVWMDGEMAMLVLPASRAVNFDLLRKETGAKDVSFANESDFKSKFPGCETGAMPPFGSIFEMRTIVDSKVTKPDHVIFRAGDHDTAVRMKREDFHELAGADIVSFSVRKMPSEGEEEQE